MVYKYQTIDKFFWANFTKNALWFSSRKDFDDDFDSFLPIETEMSKQEIESFLRLSWKLNFGTQPDLNFGLGRAVEELASNNKMRKEFFHNLMDDHVAKAIAITCFSNDPMNRTLWGRYADKSAGVCFGFDTTKDMNFFENLEEITYKDPLPKIKMDIETFDKRIKEFVSTKHSQWSNQGETRLFRKTVGAYTYNSLCLTRIIFGTRASKHYRNKILSIGLLLNPKIEFLQLEIDRDNGCFRAISI